MTEYIGQAVGIIIGLIAFFAYNPGPAKKVSRK